MSNAIEDALHLLIDLASGKRAHLSAADADQVHEALTPGYNDKPLTDAEQAQLAELEERKRREQAKRDEAAAAKDGDPGVAPDEGASGESVASSAG